MEKRLKEKGASIEFETEVSWLKEGAAGSIAGHLDPAGHQTGSAGARGLEEFAKGERVGQQIKTFYMQNNE